MIQDCRLNDSKIIGTGMSLALPSLIEDSSDRFPVCARMSTTMTKPEVSISFRAALPAGLAVSSALPLSCSWGFSWQDGCRPALSSAFSCRGLRQRRTRRRLTQAQLARLVRSSQSRVAKMEAGDPTVSIDLLVRSFLAMGATQQELGRIIADRRSNSG